MFSSFCVAGPASCLGVNPIYRNEKGRESPASFGETLQRKYFVSASVFAASAFFAAFLPAFFFAGFAWSDFVWSDFASALAGSDVPVVGASAANTTPVAPNIRARITASFFIRKSPSGLIGAPKL